MDPAISPVTIKITGTSAVLLTRLAEALGTDEGGAVMMRALGLLDLALKAKRDGRRLVFLDRSTGAMSDVVF